MADVPDDNSEALGPEFTKALGHIRLLAQFTRPTMAMLISSVIETALELALIEKMRPLSGKLKKRLFEGYGPLSSFSSRIDVAYALSIISQDVFDDLKIIKEIRNEFAHPKRTMLHFDDDAIARIAKKFSDYSHDEDNAKLFTRKSISCLEALGDNSQLMKLFMTWIKVWASLPSLPDTQPRG